MRVLKKEERGKRRGKTAWKSEAEGMDLLHGNESGEGSPDGCSEELERVLLYGLYSAYLQPENFPSLAKLQGPLSPPSLFGLFNPY